MMRTALCYRDAVVANYERQGQSVTQYIGFIKATHGQCMKQQIHETMKGKKTTEYAGV